IKTIPLDSIEKEVNDDQACLELAADSGKQEILELPIANQTEVQAQDKVDPIRFEVDETLNKKEIDELPRSQEADMKA
ncbi:hypothetical protein NL495_28975, partial [Klebsiella pneumoniae]|nr:hypothetical protein [Klebsiella pneumoniae]